MSTPRSESIAKARSGDVLPIATPGTDTLALSKSDHYAALGVVMHESFQRYVADDEVRAELARSTSVYNLGRAFTDTITTYTNAVLESPEFEAIHSGLRQSQLERGRADKTVTTRLEFILEDGARTFAAAAESLYNAVEQEFSSELARMPANASVLDRLAKLNIVQFNAYGLHYLFDDTRRRAVASHLVADERGVRFKPGFPQNALVPTVLAQNGGIYTNSDLSLSNPHVIPVGDIQPDRPKDGCPITFYSDQIPELWNMYTGARQALQRRFDMGRQAVDSTDLSSDDTVASQ